MTQQRVLEDTDYQRVKRCRGGDLAAFEELVSHHERGILNFCYRLAGNLEDAKDLTQETFVRAYRSLDRFEPQGKFSTWLYTIARNRCLNFLRDQKWRRNGRISLSAETESGRPLEIADSKDRPDQEAERMELKRRIEQAVGSLKEKYRAVIVLREFHGFSYDEIARILKIRRGTVKSRIARGRLALQVKLRPYLRGLTDERTN